MEKKNFKRKASIDMGTNTFQLLIADVDGQKIEKIFTNDIFVRLGKGGISERIITDDAKQRAFAALDIFRENIKKYKALSVSIAGTSAVRSAKNAQDFIDEIFEKYGYQVEILSGDSEAQVIYQGVKSDTSIESSAIIMDIGGGSVEFIIADEKKVRWKKSFEIGAQRLYDMFCKEDPISIEHQEQLADYINGQITSFIEEVQSYNEMKFIGAAGTFQTIQDIYGAKYNCIPETVKKVSFQEYKEMHELFLSLERKDRFNIPGLIPERVDMIIPASLLLFNILNLLKVKEVNISTGALREGLILF